MTTTVLQTPSTPEYLAGDPASVPAWARGATTIERDGYGYECHEILRDQRTVGWMYDDGAGYIYGEGVDEPDPLRADELGCPPHYGNPINA